MKLLCALCALIVALGGAAYLTAPPSPTPTEDYVLIVESQEPEKEATVRLLTEQGIVTLPETEYLTCVVLSECLPSFSVETMKAQAVAARTFAHKHSGKHDGADVCASSACCQAYRSREALLARFGGDFESFWEKAAAAVRATDGEMLYYGGALIDAVYFSCSGGRSEAAVAVWGSDVPYLQSVESPGEEACGKFESEIAVPFASFRETLLSSGKDVSFSPVPQSWIGEITRSEGGGILTAELAGAAFTGTELRALFSLPSTNVELSVRGGDIVFHAFGSGHRVGMSQYGAEAMAQQGSTYREILQHYYTGVEIQ